MSVLVADDVSRSYGDTVALDGVSLSVDEGDVFALVGPNGAGKTTLVRALTGTTEFAGSVELWGQQPTAVDRERIGLLPQSFTPPDRLTPRELLEYYAGLYDTARDVDGVLADVGLDSDDDTYYDNLSGGQQRRTCVATALVNDPDLLVLDEPTTGIDPAGRRNLWTLLEELAAAGTTIFLTTHYMEEAHHLADRVGLLADGELVALDDPDSLVVDYGGESLLLVTGEFPADVDTLLAYETTHHDGQLSVRNVPPEDIGAVVETLDGAEIAYDSVTWKEPTLEDVYLELTGHGVSEGGDSHSHGSGDDAAQVTGGDPR